MKRRPALILPMIVTLLIALSAQAQEPVDLTIYYDRDNLTIYIPPTPESVSLIGLTFDVTLPGGQTLIYRLSQFPAFQVPLAEVPAPICLRLQRFGSTAPPPLACQTVQNIIQPLADSDVFWYDLPNATGRTFRVLRERANPLICPAGQNLCAITYVPPTHTPTPTLTPLQAALERARGFDGGNAAWQPFAWDFDGVPMVLVPTGCFMMGTSDVLVADLTAQFGAYFNDETPQHEQCFDEPFWIDKYEVTNAHYGSVGAWFGADRPREIVMWPDARDHCAARDGVAGRVRLPTEAEWEYAARGPDGLTYPWGDAFVADYAVTEETSGGQTAPVGSRPDGASWVGAEDLAGNVWEWVSSLYTPYPFDATEGDADASPTDLYIVRGGSWFENRDFARAAYRQESAPDAANGNYGFRCARDVDSR
ncbi:MAG: formylglycine-generating enzyme family protein [Chloroflexi bacterium]|nr:formylglycine-generating enzyme family protein [Chloroflexota bacterium]